MILLTSRSRGISGFLTFDLSLSSAFLTLINIPSFSPSLTTAWAVLSAEMWSNTSNEFQPCWDHFHISRDCSCKSISILDRYGLPSFSRCDDSTHSRIVLYAFTFKGKYLNFKCEYLLLSPRMTNSPLKVFTIIIFSLFLLISSIISIFNLDKVYSAPVLWPFLTIEALSQQRWPRSMLYCTIVTQEHACMMRVKREFQGPLIDTASTPLIYWYTHNTLIHYGHTQNTMVNWHYNNIDQHTSWK